MKGTAKPHFGVAERDNHVTVREARQARQRGVVCEEIGVYGRTKLGGYGFNERKKCKLGFKGITRVWGCENKVKKVSLTIKNKKRREGVYLAQVYVIST